MYLMYYTDDNGVRHYTLEVRTHLAVILHRLLVDVQGDLDSLAVLCAAWTVCTGWWPTNSQKAAPAQVCAVHIT